MYIIIIIIIIVIIIIISLFNVEKKELKITIKKKL